MRGPSGSLLVSSVLATAALSHPAHAQQSPRALLELTWSAPAECPQQAEVEREIAALVGVRSAAEAKHLRARVGIVEASPGNFSLSLETELDGITGERTVHGGPCHVVADAAVLTLAIILNPDVEHREQTLPANEARARAASPSEAPRAARPAAAPERRARDSASPRTDASEPSPAFRVRWAVAAHAGAHGGVLSQLGPELGLGGGVLIDRASLWLSLALQMPEDATVPGRSDKGAKLWAGSLTALGCWAVLDARARLDACAGVEAFRLRGDGAGVDYPRSGEVSWIAPAAGARLGSKLRGWLGIEVALMGMVPLRRPAVFLDDIGEIHRPSGLGGKLYAGLVLAPP